MNWEFDLTHNLLFFYSFIAHVLSSTCSEMILSEY